MKHNDDEKAYDRRGFLQCMAWVGPGAMWTLTSGVPKSMPIEQAARGAMGHGAGIGGLRFVQISDSHIGFDKPANTDVTATLRAAVAKIKAAAERPSFGHRGSARSRNPDHGEAVCLRTGHASSERR